MAVQIGTAQIAMVVLDEQIFEVHMNRLLTCLYIFVIQ